MESLLEKMLGCNALAFRLQGLAATILHPWDLAVVMEALS